MFDIAGKTVFVTGASGLIGSSVVKVLLDAGANVIAAGRSVERLQGKLGEIPGLSFSQYDATRRNVFTFKADCMVIAASPASPDLFLSKPVDLMLANTVAVCELLDYAIKARIGKVVYVSSSEVYGKMEPPATGFTEDHFGEIDLANPRNCYAESKRAAELLCVSYASQYGLDVSIVRPGHVYGPTATDNDKRVSSLWPRMAAKGEDIVMKSDGAQLRSYVYCHDCATAILTVIQKGAPAKAYNISNRDSVVSIRTLAETICRIANVKLRMEVPSDSEKKRFNPMAISSLDASALEDLGWRAEYDIERGLSEHLSVLNQREW